MGLPHQGQGGTGSGSVFIVGGVHLGRSAKDAFSPARFWLFFLGGPLRFWRF